MKCQAAFPSATQNEISAEDAKTLVANGCYCVAEGANMPTEPEGVDVFLQAKILYGPGKAANAGGVAVSGLEMTQNAGVTKWTREEVDQNLQEIMKSIHANCVKYGKNGQVDELRQGRQHRRLRQGGRRHARPRRGLNGASPLSLWERGRG